MISIPADAVAAHPIDIEPGFAIAPGARMSVRSFQAGASATSHVFGYVVPTTDAPSTTKIVGP